MEENFWNIVKIWSQKPHVVNKRLVGVSVIGCWKFMSDFPSWESIVEKFQNIAQSEESEPLAVINNFKWEKAEPWKMEDYGSSECLVSLRKCLPKQHRRFSNELELEFLDFRLKCAVYIPLKRLENRNETSFLMPQCSYAILSTETIQLIVYKNDDAGSWLLSNLLPKLHKWHDEIDQNPRGIESLRLVPLEDYNRLYLELKDKYVPNIATIWPECTDPQKFIHEDVAIAAYLILLWQKERESLQLDEDYRQSFIDIGCGNGLLVYLLASEGYKGKGIDIRARKIWSLYPEHVKLEVMTFIPTEETTLQEYDWLLGNHSDELTPWLPVVALQSSAKRLPDLLPTRYWVLPCCPFSFFAKFEREKHGTGSSSRYAEYLKFVAQVGRICGYDVEEDRMRIPSTRRTCHVGQLKRMDKSELNVLLEAKSKLIAESKNGSLKDSFKPRAAVEEVRNCTRLDRGIQDELVRLTAECLLSETPANEHGKWSAGGSVNIADVVKKISEQFTDFHRLKSECGGFQTLLRNHSHIFVVQNKCVRFRSPDELSADEWRKQQKSGKKRPHESTTMGKRRKECWFFFNHPDGCPLDADSCRYLHTKAPVMTSQDNAL